MVSSIFLYPIHFELPRLAAGNSKCSWVEGHGTRTIARLGEVTHAPVSGRRGTHSAREAGDRRCSSRAWWPHTPLCRRGGGTTVAAERLYPHTPLCRGGGAPTVPGRQGTDGVRRALDGFSFENCSDSYQVQHKMNINNAIGCNLLSASVQNDTQK